jgi:surfeit locus 1 family protein
MRTATMNTNVPASVRRFRPAFVPTVAAMLAFALFIAAGNWQRGRMDQKLALRAQLDAAAAQAAVPLPASADWDAWRYRPVIAAGTFDAAHQILLDNRIVAGRPGYEVVTPLVLADGRVVLVNRGWIAGGATRDTLPGAPPPAARVTVEGRVNVPTARYLELRGDAVQGALWQNLDPGRFAQATGLSVLPIVIEQTRPLDGTDTLARAWPAPDVGADKHRIYMLQWYAFAALAAFLWLFFTFRRKR